MAKRYVTFGGFSQYVLNVDHDGNLFAIIFQLSAEIITIIVNKYIDDDAEVDALNLRLREICPSLYSLDDVITSRVCNRETILACFQECHLD